MSVVLAGGGSAELVSGLGCAVVRMDDESPDFASVTAAPRVDTTGDDVAYVLYTSGSTGEPV